MRKYHDFDQGFKYLMRSKVDKYIEKSFNQEVERATKSFINNYLRGDSIMTAEVKSRGSYGVIITDLVMLKLYQILNKQENKNVI